MDTLNKPSIMDQEIFTLHLSKETVSVYILCCSLYDNGSSISTKNLINIWNSTEESLHKCLKELEKVRIIGRIISDGDENTIYKIIDKKEWIKNDGAL